MSFSSFYYFKYRLSICHLELPKRIILKRNSFADHSDLKNVGRRPLDIKFQTSEQSGSADDFEFFLFVSMV